MKKIISLVICVTMVLSVSLPFSITVNAAAPQFEYEAQMLYNLGLFKGTENGFDLDKPCDRLQGSTLFIRLLGEEKDALDKQHSHPFNDVQNNWASPYIGQMYHKGYTKGISDTEYGVSNMTANQFATFCLRALNYNDSAGDFHYSSALNKMLELKIINQEAYDIISNQEFTRDSAVKLAYSTLFAEINGTERDKYGYYSPGSRDILIMNLLRANAINNTIFEKSILKIYDDLYFHTSKESSSRIALEYEDAQKDTFFLKYEDRELNFSPTISVALPKYNNNIANEYVVENDLITRAYLGGGNICKMQILYRDEYRCSQYFKNPDSVELSEVEKEIVEYTKKNFLDKYIKEGMSDYDKIRAAYEFTMESITYGYKGSPNSNLYMALFEHQGICSTYSNLFSYLANVLGFEVYSLTGLADNGIKVASHGWNKIKIGDDYYNLDATWDDDNYTQNRPYDYFLVSDEYISRNHDGGTGIDCVDEKIKATNTQYDPK